MPENSVPDIENSSPGAADDAGYIPYYNDMPLDQASDLEPMSLEEVSALREEGIKMGLDKLQAHGPEAIFVAGFRLEELPLLHSVLCIQGESGNGKVRIIPVTDQILSEPIHKSLDSLHVTNDAIRGDVGLCRSWGMERVLLFSGLNIQTQATLFDLVEELGLGKVTPAMVDDNNCKRRLGDVLAEAVQEYRKAVSRKKQGQAPMWEQLGTEPAVGPGEYGGGAKEVKDGDWMSQLPTGYDLKSDDPTNLGNAINQDGTIDSEFVGGLMGGVREQMLEALKKKGLDIDAFDGDLSVDVGGAGSRVSLVPEEPFTETKAQDQGVDTDSCKANDVELSAGKPNSVELSPTTAPPLVNASEERLPAEVFAEQADAGESPSSSSSSSSPAAASSAATGDPALASDPGVLNLDIDEGRSSALEAVKSALEGAMGSGLTTAELEALIDDAFADSNSGRSPAAELIKTERPGDTYVSLSEFKKQAAMENQRQQSQADQEEVEGVQVMSKAQLRETAERHNLDLEQLLRDAESRGIKIRED